MNHQPAILALPPACGRFLTLALAPGADPREGLGRLRAVSFEANLALGLGAPLLAALGKTVGRLRPAPALCGRGVAIPSTQGALWFFVGGEDGGKVLLRARGLVRLLGDAFVIDEDVAAFRYGSSGSDLTGFEDGTENPKGDRAAEVALVTGEGRGQDGGSFVAVQRWVHDTARFDRFSSEEKDLAVGRRMTTNEEIADAPASAHVKRTAQESFDPPAFMVRRSLPFGSVSEHGLYFVAYGASLDPFERSLRRMVGLEDGVVDGLFSFTRPVTGGYYWCPPVDGSRLDLRALGV
jgi:putative iron-dependent peroxidase